MRRRLAFAAVLGALLSTVLATPSGTASGHDLRARLTQTLRSPHLSLQRTAAIALDVRTGAVIYAHNATRPVVPASNEKLRSLGGARAPGPGYRFRTEVLAVGSALGDLGRRPVPKGRATRRSS